MSCICVFAFSLLVVLSNSFLGAPIRLGLAMIWNSQKLRVQLAPELVRVFSTVEPPSEKKRGWRRALRVRDDKR